MELFIQTVVTIGISLVLGYSLRTQLSRTECHAHSCRYTTLIIYIAYLPSIDIGLYFLMLLKKLAIKIQPSCKVIIRRTSHSNIQAVRLTD